MIVVAGESLVDRLVRPECSVAETPGGGPFNVARALGRLGVAVAFAGRISTDRMGEVLLGALREDGVDLSLVTRTDDPTLVAMAEIDPAGAAHYRFDVAGTAAPGLTESDVPGLPASTTILHVGTLGLVLEPMATTIERLVVGARPEVLVMADPNIRPTAIADPAGYRARLDRLLVRVDVVAVSVDDLAWLQPGRAAIEAARRLVAAGPAVALVTDGPRPVRIVCASAAEVRAVDVPAADVVDTVGAGDAFGAGFLAAWVGAGLGLGRAGLADTAALAIAAATAVEVASWSTTRAGACAPTRAELRARAVDW